MEIPATLSELLNKFINNETTIVVNSKPVKNSPSPSTEKSLFPQQAETFYQSHLPLFKMAEVKEACITSNRFYFKLIRTLFFSYFPKTVIHLPGTYTQGGSFFTGEWVFSIVNGKLEVKVNPQGFPSNTIFIDTKNYQ